MKSVVYYMTWPYYYNVHKFRNSIWSANESFEKILFKLNCVTDCLHYIMKGEHFIGGDYNLIYKDQLRNVLAIDMAALYDIYQHVIRQQFNEDIPEIYLGKFKEVYRDIANIMY